MSRRPSSRPPEPSGRPTRPTRPTRTSHTSCMSFIARLLRRPAASPAAAIPDPTDPTDADGPRASAAPAPAQPAPVQPGAACPSWRDPACAAACPDATMSPVQADHRHPPHRRSDGLPDRGGGRGVRSRSASMSRTWPPGPQPGAEWLRLARGVGAPEDRRRRIEAHAVTVEAVEEAKTLYLSAATKAAHTAKTARDWNAVARILGERAGALYREAGSPVPPPDEIVAIHADAMTALLRSLRGTGTHAEVVGSTCCQGCRTDDGRAYAIADELHTPRLPHPGCPRGLCACEWFVAGTPKKRRTRRKRTTPT